MRKEICQIDVVRENFCCFKNVLRNIVILELPEVMVEPLFGGWRVDAPLVIAFLGLKRVNTNEV